MSASEQGKRAAAEAAVAEVEGGMLVGLGTGSTATFAIQALARRVAAGLAVRAVATSLATAEAAAAAGIAVLDFADIATVDLCIDGVDEIDPGLRAIKGAGGAMLREKIVATAATRMIAIADASKAVDRIGARPVPVEFLPFARSFVALRLADLGGTPVLRMAGTTPYRTDQGHPVFDCAFASIDDPTGLAAALSCCPGVLAHGLFLTEIDSVYFGSETGATRRDRTF